MANRRYYRPKHIKKFADGMRRKLSAHELMFLRRLTLGNVAPFDFQVRIGFYVADFVFPSKMLIIELDGPHHDPDKDAKRDEWLGRAGFTTWRIPNSKAALWPLNRIAQYERPTEGRGFVDAVRWANGQHDHAVAIRSRPSPAMSLEVREESKEQFYRRLIAKTKQIQDAETERLRSYANRDVKLIKRSAC
jgi:very-short-patch-repair endonuclease